MSMHFHACRGTLKRGRFPGTLVLVAVMLAGMGTPAIAQLQSKAQQACLNSVYKAAVKVGATQGKENARCIKNAGAHKLVGQTADECLVADSRGKVQKAFNKTVDAEAKRCSPSDLPSFGYTSASAANASARPGAFNLTKIRPALVPTR